MCVTVFRSSCHLRVSLTKLHSFEPATNRKMKIRVIYLLWMFQRLIHHQSANDGVKSQTWRTIAQKSVLLKSNKVLHSTSLVHHEIVRNAPVHMSHRVVIVVDSPGLRDRPPTDSNRGQ